MLLALMLASSSSSSSKMPTAAVEIGGELAALPSCAANVTVGLGLGAMHPGDRMVATDAKGYGACCGGCTSDPACIAFTWVLYDPEREMANCTLRHTVGTHYKLNPTTSKASGYMNGRAPPPPPPPPAPLPPPPPAPAGSQRNIVYITNDDQDQILGSMRAMPHTTRLLGEGGANLTQFRVNTPICCPSRSSMLTGRFEHNNRVSSLAGGGCMHMNSSRFDNPGFWTGSHPVRLHKLGYLTGFFGKVLNGMNSYGCDGTSGLPPGLDRQLTMCTHTFFNCSWVVSAAHLSVLAVMHAQLRALCETYMTVNCAATE
jgi:hypothetical protein